MKGVILAEFLPHVSTVYSATYCATLTKLRHAIRDKHSATYQHIRLMHNARPHVSRPVREKLQGYGWKVLEHPSYSPDLAPSDFHLFGPMKKFFGGKKFDSDDELKRAVRRWLFSQPTEFYETEIFKLIHRWESNKWLSKNFHSCFILTLFFFYIICVTY
ncbi:hypothetical protein AVEN_230719-1 [Araneus ventricosus]|uniref:Histone-lysine N-methyltransferase SETMAR n=1 Tax=Araneus ventricosus TaxID=182803 RepID=A0A4Y2A396_ARAVE|nr:hypothetical protein AVEN_230719-1 [Araneus ventricosus]